MSDIKNPSKTKIVTGVCRLSYANLLYPMSNTDGQNPRYSVSIVIPKTDTVTINAIMAATRAAYEAGSDKLRIGKTVPAYDKVKHPLRDGDEERPDDPVYAGCYFINASSVRKPQIIDTKLHRLDDPDTVYSGMYARVSINMYAFSAAGNRGIAAGLNNVLKVRDGERLGGAATAEEDFAAFLEDITPDDPDVLSDSRPPF